MTKQKNNKTTKKQITKRGNSDDNKENAQTSSSHPQSEEETVTGNNSVENGSSKTNKTKQNKAASFSHICDFKPLFNFFDNVMDLDRDGLVSYNDWQYLLIEFSPHLRYELDSTKIQKCFNEFDLAKNNILTKEECAVVMGMSFFLQLFLFLLVLFLFYGCFL